MTKERHQELVSNLIAGLGFVLIGASIFLSMSQITEAATRTVYKETWETEEYYHALITWNQRGNIPAGSRWYCLGPSKWKVRGATANSGFTEYWYLGNLPPKEQRNIVDDPAVPEIVPTNGVVDLKGEYFYASTSDSFGPGKIDVIFEVAGNRRNDCIGAGYLSTGHNESEEFKVMPNGLYGGWLQNIRDESAWADYKAREMHASFRIIPTRWSIVGEITTP